MYRILYPHLGECKEYSILTSASVHGVDDGDADEPRLAVIVGDGEREPDGVEVPVGVRVPDAVADGVSVREELCVGEDERVPLCEGV